MRSPWSYKAFAVMDNWEFYKDDQGVVMVRMSEAYLKRHRRKDTQPAEPKPGIAVAILREIAEESAVEEND